MPLTALVEGDSGLLVLLQILILKSNLAGHIKPSLLLLEYLLFPDLGLLGCVNIGQVDALKPQDSVKLSAVLHFDRVLQRPRVASPRRI